MKIFHCYVDKHISSIKFNRAFKRRYGSKPSEANTLFIDSVKLPSWKIWIEPIIFKFCYHICSLLNLYDGTELPFKKGDENIRIFDEPSILILFRASFENYLTFFYLFIDNVSEEEKEFRMLVWRYSGLKQRSEFKIDSEEARAKQIAELPVVKSLKDEISKSRFFQSFNKSQKQRILEGKKPRLFHSWNSLVAKSNLRKDLFQNIYGYKSNYSHSEFISILQIHDGKYGYHEGTMQSHYLMLLLHGIIGKMVIQLKEHLPSIAQHFENLNDDKKEEFIYLNDFCSNDVSR